MPSGRTTSVIDFVQSLVDTHQELVDEGDEHRQLPLIPQMRVLLAQGRQDVIWAAAARIHRSSTGVADFLHHARHSACSHLDGGLEAALFAIPLSMGSRPRSEARQGCPAILGEQLQAWSPGGSLRMAPLLIRHDLLSQWGLSDLHDLLQAMRSDDWQARTLDLLEQDPDGSSTWSGQLLEGSSHLYWAVGLSLHADGQEPFWLHASPSLNDFQMMAMAAWEINERFAVHTELGWPSSMHRQIRDGAFNEAANGILNGCSVALQSGLGMEELTVRAFHINDASMPQAGAFSAHSRSHIRLELVGGKPISSWCCFEFSCDSIDAAEGLDDLIQVLKNHVGEIRIETVSHDEAGNLAVAADIPIHGSDFFPEDDIVLYSSAGQFSHHRPFVH
jgi:hypothetical protein